MNLVKDQVKVSMLWQYSQVRVATFEFLFILKSVLPRIIIFLFIQVFDLLSGKSKLRVLEDGKQQVKLFIYVCVFYLFIYLSIYLFVYLSFYLSNIISSLFFLFLLFYLLIFICLFDYLCICLFIYLTIYFLSFYLSIHQNT